MPNSDATRGCDGSYNGRPTTALHVALEWHELCLKREHDEPDIVLLVSWCLVGGAQTLSIIHRCKQKH